MPYSHRATCQYKAYLVLVVSTKFHTWLWIPGVITKKPDKTLRVEGS